MTSFTNNSNLPLSVAVWLANDNYAHDDRSNHISVTSLIKPIKQLVLGMRVDVEVSKPDITSLVAARMGTAIHDGIESSWVGTKLVTNLTALGIPLRVAERVVVNPDPADLTENQIPVYLEQRVEKEVNGFIISGQFDFVGEGRVEDFKSTSVYTYIYNTNTEKYKLQGSIYRWLNPEIITRDEMAIQFIFTDWSGQQAAVQKTYPKTRVLEQRIPLMTLVQTDNYVKNRIAMIQKYLHEPEANIPECSNEDLWRKPTVWKYYTKETNKRASNNFDSRAEAMAKASINGGIVKEVKGQIVACRYCPAFPICKQKDAYLNSGELKLMGA
jgi:hypothetical protein